MPRTRDPFVGAAWTNGTAERLHLRGPVRDRETVVTQIGLVRAVTLHRLAPR